jgi:hypothetical protein
LWGGSLKSVAGPEGIGEVHDNGFGSASNYDPFEGQFTGGIDLLVGQPRRDVEKVPGVRGRVELPSLAPADIGRSVENVDDCVLFAMVMDARASLGFDSE